MNMNPLDVALRQQAESLRRSPLALAASTIPLAPLLGMIFICIY
jgi:hypothetical protein